MPVQIKGENHLLCFQTWSVLNLAEETIGILTAQFNEQPHTTMRKVTPSNLLIALPRYVSGGQKCFLEVETLNVIDGDDYCLKGKLEAKMYGPPCEVLRHLPQYDVARCGGGSCRSGGS